MERGTELTVLLDCQDTCVCVPCFLAKLPKKIGQYARQIEGAVHAGMYFQLERFSLPWWDDLTGAQDVRHVHKRGYGTYVSVVECGLIQSYSDNDKFCTR
jgi:hypothetical protein